eukprot:COSAG06_NODE_55861_length_287_cov_1.191489_1_plen_40_part_01
MSAAEFRLGDGSANPYLLQVRKQNKTSLSRHAVISQGRLR